MVITVPAVPLSIHPAVTVGVTLRLTVSVVPDKLVVDEAPVPETVVEPVLIL